MTGLRKISGNNKHSVVLSSDIKEASFVTQTLTSHHVCNRGGFFCLQISSHSRIMRASCTMTISSTSTKFAVTKSIDSKDTTDIVAGPTAGTVYINIDLYFDIKGNLS